MHLQPQRQHVLREGEGRDQRGRRDSEAAKLHPRREVASCGVVCGEVAALGQAAPLEPLHKARILLGSPHRNEHLESGPSCEVGTETQEKERERGRAREGAREGEQEGGAARRLAHLSSRSVGGCSVSSVAAATVIVGFPFSKQNSSQMQDHRSTHAASRSSGSGAVYDCRKYGNSPTVVSGHIDRVTNAARAVQTSDAEKVRPSAYALCKTVMHSPASTSAPADGSSESSGAKVASDHVSPSSSKTCLHAGCRRE